MAAAELLLLAKWVVDETTAGDGTDDDKDDDEDVDEADDTADDADDDVDDVAATAGVMAAIECW